MSRIQILSIEIVMEKQEIVMEKSRQNNGKYLQSLLEPLNYESITGTLINHLFLPACDCESVRHDLPGAAHLGLATHHEVMD